MNRMKSMAVMVLLVFAVLPAAAGTASGEYLFKIDVPLELGVVVEEGLTIETVRFYTSGRGPASFFRVGDVMKAEISISNVSENGKMVGLAVALFDEKGKLLGVASGGNKFLPQRDERQRTYTLVFNHVNALADTAASFKVTVETR
ncbi:MAG: hypothetical protein IFK94_00435 [Acidobacteria bacterium]|uniref:DUF4352 domain-containing protein n=1 Tax=Candidatus Polarisedimenticola svalbardensis TaxID=2886004 RepID=A0A8J7CBR0_9BACT|nr:hypothetical protein [Candidatus Polarisedimenticola svalbardensis]